MQTIRSYTKGHGATTLAYGLAPLASSTLFALITTQSASFTLSGGVSGGGNWSTDGKAILGGDNSEFSQLFYCVAAGGATTVTCSATIGEGIVLEVTGTALSFLASVAIDQTGSLAISTGAFRTHPDFSYGFAVAMVTWSGAGTPTFQAPWVSLDRDVNNETTELFFLGDVVGPNTNLGLTSTGTPTGPCTRILLFRSAPATQAVPSRGMSVQQRRAA